MHMNSGRFAKMTDDEKTVMIMEKGKFVSKGKFLGLEVDLYKIEDSFVEIWYDLFLDKITRIEYLQNKSVNPYLKYLKICTDN